MKVPEALVNKALPKSHPRAAMQADHISDVDGIMRDAVANKFFKQPMSKEQVVEFYRFPNLGK